MLPWIKLESSLLLDSRIQALLDDHGFCGLGIYVAMRTTIESISEDGLPLPQVLAVGVPRTRKNKMLRILQDYGLFAIDDCGIVTALSLAPAHTSAQTPALIPGLTSGQEPSEERTEKKQTIVRFRKPTLAEVSDYCLSRHNGINPQHFYDYQEARGWMLGKSKMKDWKAAIRTWERHALSDNGYRMMDNGFPSTSSQSPSSSSHHPSTLHQLDGVQYFNGRPLPKDAPPRPSPTAEWDDASQSWFDLYH